MAEIGIREFTAKQLIYEYFHKNPPKEKAVKLGFQSFRKTVLVQPEIALSGLARKNPWLKKEPLAMKPDELFGKRGKHNLVLLDKKVSELQKKLKKYQTKTIEIDGVKGTLKNFLIEPFIPHDEEYYLSFELTRDGDLIRFSQSGGVDVEEYLENAPRLLIPTGSSKLPHSSSLEQKLLKKIPKARKPILIDCIQSLFNFYRQYGFTYLECNPLVFTKDEKKIIPLDVVAKVDSTSLYLNKHIWSEIEFPEPFGGVASSAERMVQELDEKSGASFKLRVLNPKGNIWTLVAGGGASVIYTDTVCDLGKTHELGNYGEYSGNPTPDETFQYASIVLDLATQYKTQNKKYLLIGGGIANFTDVSNTFIGIIQALHKYAQKLRNHKVKIFVRRGGPKYEKALEMITAAGKELKIPIEVYGPETHMTSIVSKI